MAWEMRGKSGPYFYRSIKKNGKVHRKYYGRGELAHIDAECMINEQYIRAIRQARRAEKDREKDNEIWELRQFCRLVDIATEILLEDAGFHKHKGEWRKKQRGKKDRISNDFC